MSDLHIRHGVRYDVLVSYDYDYGWIVEVLHLDEYEMEFPNGSFDPGFGHDDEGRQDALSLAFAIAGDRGLRVYHWYEHPDSVREKHERYMEIAS